MAVQVPVVDHLVLQPEPHLKAAVCDTCGATYLARRNACASCGGTAFGTSTLGSEGTLTAFTIVHRAAPGIPVPFTSAIVQITGGPIVQANLVGVEADPAHVELGMPVRLTTFVAGTDDNGAEAIAYGFTPANPPTN